MEEGTALLTNVSCEAVGWELTFEKEVHRLLLLATGLEESLVEQLEGVLPLPREVCQQLALFIVSPMSFVAQVEVLA